MLAKKIKSLATKYHKATIAHRRHIHQFPELSFQEKETARYVAKALKALKIPFKTGIGGYGIVGLIKGNDPTSKTLALRADMDALPIQEANKVSYKSKHPGVMHACGHDVHTSSLLGTARILQDIKNEFSGTVKLIFQPAEEKSPGGASLMIKDGVLRNPSPAGILGQHVHPPLAVGKVGFRPGQYMASTDELYLKIKGKGGHGALPANCIDPIVISAQIITALQQVVSRRANPAQPTVLTFGNIASKGGATNVIPNEVLIMGTFRTMDEAWRKKGLKIMKKMATDMAKAMGARCEFETAGGYPSLYNHEELTKLSKSLAIDYLGKSKVVDLPIRMTGEDFSFYSQAIPACFYRLGTGNAKAGITSPVHTNTFNVDEQCLELSTGLMAWLAVNQLSHEF